MRLKQKLSIFLATAVIFSAQAPISINAKEDEDITASLFKKDEVTAESLIENFKKKAGEAKSIACKESYDYVVSMTVFDQKQETSLNYEADIQSAFGTTYMTGVATFNIDHKNQTLYANAYASSNDDGSETVYINYEDDTNWEETWVKAKRDNHCISKIYNNIITGEDFELTEEPVEIGEKKYYEVKGKATADEIMKRNGVNGSEAMQTLPIKEEMLKDITANAYYYFNTETLDLEIARLNATESAQKFLEKIVLEEALEQSSGFTEEQIKEMVEVTVSGIISEYRDIEIGTVEEIEIPENVLAAQEV